jgi:hypothetical protein
VTEKYGNLKGVAKAKRISSIDTFIQKFMFDGGLDSGENLKYCPEDYTSFIEAKNRVFYVLGDDENDERIIKLLKDILPPLVTTSSDENNQNAQT